MKERIQNRINAIRDIAGADKGTVAAHKPVAVHRPDNALSQSIRNEKEAVQFKAELKAAVLLGKTR